ncbi:MAG: SDR family NAD(P)-dependent oxidoreductase [Pseudomonadota bacterium]
MPHALITGASDGIGRALVDVYHAKGWEITATARRPHEAVSPPLPCNYVPLDLTKPADTLLDALPERLDLAILNAGAGKVAPPEDHSAEDIAQMIALNTTAQLLLAHALFPRLQGGTLAFIGSTAARGAHKDFSVYAATKAAISGAARSLALEWEGRVKVLMLHPGPTATAMHDKAGLGDIAARRFFTPPAKVAASLAQAIDAGKNRRLGAAYTARHALGGLFK